MPWTEQFQPANWGLASCIAVGAYLLGCVTTGYYYVRWRTGQDLRQLGSGSAGARNAGRALGWRGFTFTLLGDFAKGAVAVFAARQFTSDERLLDLALLAVVAGHIWPVQLRCHGGRGVATAVGALLVYDFRLAAALALLFGGAAALSRKVVLPGLLAFACLPLVSAFIQRESDPVRAASLCLLAGLVIIAHRRGGVRLSAESRHGATAARPSAVFGFRLSPESRCGTRHPEPKENTHEL
jgi:glycerol-3-phosphate acyltransferase PlsY